MTRSTSREELTMGLDIYAGTMPRYYAKNWKTSVQQFCEEHGIKFNLITPTQNNECTVPPEEIQGDPPIRHGR